MQPNDPPLLVASTDQLGHANEVQPLVRRLDDMAAGWLCAGLPDAELPAEAAREIERLRAALTKANSQAEHFEREWYLRGDALQAVADAEAADTLGIEAPLLGTVKAALRT